jgi:hypothetical protein
MAVIGAAGCSSTSTGNGSSMGGGSGGPGMGGAAGDSAGTSQGGDDTVTGGGTNTTTTGGAAGNSATGGAAGTEVVDAGGAPSEAGAQGCNPVVAAHPDEGNLHEAICAPLVYHTNPPSSGNHYPIWGVYKSYTKNFPPGFWVHNLEHGAVVITYNCNDGCAAEVAQAQALINSLPPDPDCPNHRLVMLPDPDLDVRFAASAWGFTLKASCFDRAAFAKFISDHYGHGLELVCDDGIDPLTAGTAGQPVCP